MAELPPGRSSLDDTSLAALQRALLTGLGGPCPLEDRSGNTRGVRRRADGTTERF